MAASSKFDSGYIMARDADDAIGACEDAARADGMRLVDARAVFHSFYMRFRVRGTLVAVSWRARAELGEGIGADLTGSVR